MTAADIDPITATFIRNDWGDRRLNLEFVTSHPETHPIVAEADGVVVGTGVAQRPRAGRLDRDDLRGAGLATSRGRDGDHPGDDRDGRGRRLPDARPRRDRGRPADVRTARVRGPDRLPGPRRAGPAGDRRGRPPGACLSNAGDLAAITALDAAATGEDRGHLLRAFAAPDTTRVLDDGDGSLGGFVVRAPWGGGATIAPDPDDALAILRARRVAAGTGSPRPRRRARRERGGTRPDARRRLDGVVARAAPRPGRPAALAARRDLGSVQPRVRVTRGQGPRRVWSNRHPGHPPKG